MNVLSLFDGISCGQVALNRAEILYDNYFASEIDKHAIKITMKNYPKTIQLGSVLDVKEEKLPKIDLLIGGSPCQGFSLIGKQLNFNDHRSKLFFEFVKLLKSLKPKYFLLENVVMKKEYENIISENLNVKPILINSNLVSAQNRKRLYWTNIPNVLQPEDKNISVDSICDENHKNFSAATIGYKEGKKFVKFTNKMSTLTTYCGNPNGLGRPFFSNQEFYVNIPFDYKKIERLSPVECERLQTLPDNYTQGISNNQRFKAIGNAWTVDVIVHILKGIK